MRTQKPGRCFCFFVFLSFFASHSITWHRFLRVRWCWWWIGDWCWLAGRENFIIIYNSSQTELTGRIILFERNVILGLLEGKRDPKDSQTSNNSLYCFWNIQNFHVRYCLFSFSVNGNPRKGSVRFLVAREGTDRNRYCFALCMFDRVTIPLGLSYTIYMV